MCANSAGYRAQPPRQPAILLLFKMLFAAPSLAFFAADIPFTS